MPKPNCLEVKLPVLLVNYDSQTDQPTDDDGSMDRRADREVSLLLIFLVLK